MAQPVCVCESEAEVLEAQTVVENLLEGEVLQLILVLHLDLYLFILLDILEAQIVLGQVNMSDALVVLKVLRQDEKVL